MRGGRTPVDIEEVSWDSLLTLIPYLQPYKFRIFLAMLCLVGAKVASVGLPFLLKRAVDALNTPENAIVVVPIALLLAYGIVRFANVLFGELRDTIFGRVTEGAMHSIGYKVFVHLHALDLAFHLERKTGGLSRDIERGVNGISFLLRFMVFNIVPTFVEVLLIIGLLLFNYHYGFALIVAVSVVCYVAFSVVATEWRTRYIREMNKAESQSSTRAVDSLLNFETVKYFNNEDYEAHNYDQDLEAWEQARRRNRLSLFGLNAGQSFIIAAAITSAMVLAGFQVREEMMTIGDFVLINALMMQIFLPLNFLGFVYREIKGSMANIDAMFKLLEVTPKVRDAEGAGELTQGEGAIEFDNVSFAYTPERQILNSVSFAVAPKQKLAIVGASGSGKSTIMKLLFRFYDRSSGDIRIDGQSIYGLTQSSLRKAISVVPQDTVLFNASIYDNIHYGDVDASEAEVWQAIEMANLKNFIDKLPEGNKTLVGERGLKLSGGEKQRVAIARALLKKPRIMVFDEATSSLDSDSEAKILDAIASVQQHYTSIVIAHRLSTVVDADQIVVLEDGVVVESGSHQGLLSHSGRYAALWQLQSQKS